MFVTCFSFTPRVNPCGTCFLFLHHPLWTPTLNAQGSSKTCNVRTMWLKGFRNDLFPFTPASSHLRRPTVQTCFAFPPSSVLWEVFVWGFGVLFLSCVCVSVSGMLFSVGVCVCVCVCDLFLFFHTGFTPAGLLKDVQCAHHVAQGLPQRPRQAGLRLRGRGSGRGGGLRRADRRHALRNGGGGHLLVTAVDLAHLLLRALLHLHSQHAPLCRPLRGPLRRPLAPGPHHIRNFPPL